MSSFKLSNTSQSLIDLGDGASLAPGKETVAPRVTLEMKRAEKAGFLLIMPIDAVDGDDDLKPDYDPDVKHGDGGGV